MGVDSVADYCEVCYDTLDDNWPYTRCEDCRREMDYDVPQLPTDSGEDNPLSV